MIFFYILFWYISTGIISLFYLIRIRFPQAHRSPYATDVNTPVNYRHLLHESTYNGKQKKWQQRKSMTANGTMRRSKTQTFPHHEQPKHQQQHQHSHSAKLLSQSHPNLLDVNGLKKCYRRICNVCPPYFCYLIIFFSKEVYLYRMFFMIF